MTEVVDILNALKQSVLERDEEKLIDIIKKVISLMTMGTDVSLVFSEMVKASNTTNLVQKKLVYLYLCNYAIQNPDLTLMAVNTFQKDCTDENPFIRGLALRSMSSLRVPNIVEYELPFVKQGLSDNHPYVRRNAVVACGKLFKVSPKIFREHSLGIKLAEMIYDVDLQTSMNALWVLYELQIFHNDNHLKLTKQILIQFLNRLSEFDDWGKRNILEVLSTFVLANKLQQEEVFAVMNLLDEFLKNCNLCIVLAVVKVFLLLVSHNNLGNLLPSVIQRIKDPLFTIMNSRFTQDQLNHYEALYCILQHIYILLSQQFEMPLSPTNNNNTNDNNIPIHEFFSESYIHFYCYNNEPAYVKHVKLRLLSSIATEKNADHILRELREITKEYMYAEPATSCHAIEAMSNILISPHVHPSETTRQFVINFYATILQLSTVQILKDQIIQSLSNVLKRFPEESVDVIDRLVESIHPTSTTSSKLAHAWLLGEFGQYTDSSVASLEQYIDRFYEHDMLLQLQVISSTVKLFLKRSVDCKPQLAKLFMKTLAPQGTLSLVVSERAEFYYKLLQSDAEKCRQVVGMNHQTVDNFFHNRNDETMKILLEEFDTLSVFTEKPSYTFLKARQRAKQMNLTLQPNFMMTADEFQSMWSKAEKNSETFSIQFEDTELRETIKTNYENASSTMVINTLLDYLPFHNMYCLAQGVLENIAKLYFCAKEVNTECILMAEITVTMTSHICAVTVRSTEPTQSTRYVKSLISDTISPQTM